MKKKHKNKEDASENEKQNTSVSNIHVKDDILDPNIEIILPDEQKRRKIQKEQLKLLLSKKRMSSKKKKRLEKYIENKFKKEVKVNLMNKLSQYKHTSGLYYSSKNMARKETKKECIKTDTQNSKDTHKVSKKPALSLSNGSEHLKIEKELYQKNPDTKRKIKEECIAFSIAKNKKQKKKHNWREMVALYKQKKFSKLENTKNDISNENYPSCDDNSDNSLQYDNESALDDVQSTFSSKNEENNTNSDSEDLENSFSENSSLNNATDVSERVSRFNEWAKEQMQTLDKVENHSTNIEDLKKSENVYKSFKPRDPTRDLSPPENISFNPNLKRKTFYVNLNRYEDVKKSRSELPIIAEEQQIMEAIFNNLCVVICGETGSGKTTQIPQFLFEAGFGNDQSDTPGMIGITQPRRVAAISMANRVAYELGEEMGKKVAYQVRFDTTIKDSTVIKFMTDGILLHELASDFLLTKYSIIIIDEAHERTINTDILIGVLSRLLKLRLTMSMEKDSNVKPLRLIIMSATLRVTDFTNNTKLFDPSPILIQIKARQYPVTIHFSKKTSHLNYVEKSFEIVSKIHKRLPPGEILVFLTGQDEIKHLCKLLSEAFPQAQKTTQSTNQLHVKFPITEVSLEVEDIDLETFNKDKISLFEKDEDSYMDNTDEYDFNTPINTSESTPNILKVVPLYSLLPTEEQLKVFEPVPKGTRLCVVATNVAETSLTIPNVCYVVDSGRAKERVYNEISGVQSFNIQWISKASADQRSGRAGRTGPGHCYRLYSSAFFDREFSMYSEPEILRMPIEGIVLKMKSMNIDNILNFPFPTPPEVESLKKAENLLMCLGALDKQNRITNLGKIMALFPLAPRYAKMIIIGQQHECLPYIVAIVSALSVDDPFIRKNELEHDINHEKTIEENNNHKKEQSTCASEKDIQLEKKNKYKKLFDAHKQFSGLDNTSDVLKLLSAVCAYAYDGENDIFCARNFLRVKTMKEIQKLRRQITDIIRSNFPNVIPNYTSNLEPPSALQIKAIKQMVAAVFIDQIAIRADLLQNHSVSNSKSKIIYTPYFTLFPTLPKYHNSTDTNNDPAVYIHSSSIIAKNINDPRLFPKYIIYHSLHRSSNLSKVKMRALTTIEANEVSALAKFSPLLTYSKPLEYPCPQIIPDSKGLMRKCWVIPRLCANNGHGNKSWDLPAKLITQKRTAGSRWETIED